MFKAILAILLCAAACERVPTTERNQLLEGVQACSQMPTCIEAGCPGAPGPAADPTDGAGLWCVAIRSGNPCFCVPSGPGADTWCMPSDAQIGGSNGSACTNDAQCSSGFCRDYKCCNSDCGGGGVYGNTSDCQACSVAHHGQTDGTCTVIADTNYVCRLYANSTCDLSERCDGLATTCPADLGQRAGQICNTATGARCPAADAGGSPHVCP